ncbi:XRE family transcriptional regulator [Streptomyces cavernae]|uniref:XRE family transcriptional regulator n=1 Tax=Streptomyces cavernae TaxID=2259034 RepID=UPI000FEC069E|nr:XRE family transcriptional regulator [Streptomyces cavernae]
MARWKALPDELDPQVREFCSQLRRLVDRSGLSIAAVSDRTGYSKTSWERYLNGRLLAPKGAIVALAEVTGTNPVHLTTMWELAERAWSRSEMRHDMTMEAIRISQARAALSEFGAPPSKGRNGKAGRSATATPGVAGPAGVSPSVPSQPSAHDREGASYGAGSGYGGSAGSPAYGRPYGNGSAPGGGRGATAPSGGAPGAPRRADSGKQRGKRRFSMFLAGVVGVLVLFAAAYFLTKGGGVTKNESAPETPSPTASTAPELPAGVKCSGEDCTGQDPEDMGCGGELATTASTATVGTARIEVRYSKTCNAAWARITQAAAGDQVTVSSSGANDQQGSVKTDTDAYTPMVAVKGKGDAKACATLKTGETGCTE